MFWRTLLAMSSTGTHSDRQGESFFPTQLGGQEEAPGAKDSQAFRSQLLAMPGGHQFSLVPSQCWVANCRQSSGSWQEVPTTSTGPKETGG